MGEGGKASKNDLKLKKLVQNSPDEQDVLERPIRESQVDVCT